MTLSQQLTLRVGNYPIRSDISYTVVLPTPPKFLDHFIQRTMVWCRQTPTIALVGSQICTLHLFKWFLVSWPVRLFRAQHLSLFATNGTIENVSVRLVPDLSFNMHRYITSGIFVPSWRKSGWLIGNLCFRGTFVSKLPQRVCCVQFNSLYSIPFAQVVLLVLRNCRFTISIIVCAYTMGSSERKLGECYILIGYILCLFTRRLC